jgi:hypothetical protein
LLHQNKPSLFKLNFGAITLLTKKENAVQIWQYHPICVLNVSFKVFTEVGTNRITWIAPKVIWPTQTAFMPWQHILDGFVVLHETIHKLQKKKMDEVLFKIDFGKVYDEVKWSFLQKTLCMKDSFTTLVWIDCAICSGGVGWSKVQ